ncbi:hypothetical protein UFOVP1192_14 [uncultured Caudovirales phage]|uniref:Uncharacterized protein n=1 Tax=uncultured Caudovirales phage TaxID=2100421 RepID=A0A6J5RDV7_9CAUD|nr:hypothetical protein UFOVP1192_14 [uncultured Caudovirales phage]
MSYALAVGGGMMALGMASSFMGSMGSNQAAEAAAMQQAMMKRNAEFQRQWSVDVNNRNILKQNLAKAFQNKYIENIALDQRAIGEIYNKMGFDNSKSQFSKQTNQINSALLSSISGRNISANSGTARALLRQNMTNAHTNMLNLNISNMNKNRDLITTYNNMLAKRDFNYTDTIKYIAGDTSSVNNQTSTGMMFAQAGIAGLSAGLQGYSMAGGFNSKPPTTPTASGAPPIGGPAFDSGAFNRSL